VLSRVRRMPPEAAGVLRACAVAGRQVEHGLLARVTGPPALDDDRLVEALRTCVEHQLLLADNDLGGYRFRHALVHEAVLDEILPGELARLHRAYAVALAGDGPAGAGPGAGADGGDRSARLAHHWSAAGDYDAALAAAVRAGVGAELAFAVPEAHRYLEWSVRLWDRAADPVGAAGFDRGELLARAAAAANWAGAMTRALTLVDEALATEPVMADPVRAGLLHERRGWYLLRAGRAADALAAYDRAVALVPPAPPTAARARVVQAQGHALLRAGRHADAGRRAEEALALAQATDDVPDEGQARHVMGLVLAAEGRSDEAVAQLHEAGQIAVGLGDLAEVAGAYVHLWRTLVEAGRGGDLVDLVFGVLPAGEDASPSLMGSIAAAALQQLGRWEEADRLLGGDSGAGGGDTSLTAVTRTLVSGALAVDRGDHDLARDRLETARAWCHQAGDGRLNGLLHRALAELAVWQERFDDARQEVAIGLGLLAHTGDPELEARLAAVGLRAEADRAAARARATGASGAAGATAGRGAEAPPEAADLMAHLDALAEAARARNAPPTCETFAAQLTGRAELSRITGRPDPGRWAQAIAAWDGIGFPYAAAYARHRRAEAVLTAGGDRDEAVAELGRAHTTAIGLGARPLAAAVERLARRARVEVARSPTFAGPGSAPAVDDAEAVAPFAPTPREAEVLALVAQGLTNRQIGQALFISEKTASVHVSRLLAKLGASTRGEAAAIARRRGLLREH
jgi:DNA-binding CsgD family transcriptional regulator/tetratricopeptide (TPR) repeat protein